MKERKKTVISSKGLNYKLKIAFSLMSVLPVLVCVYLVSHYILPQVGLKPDIAVSIFLSIFIATIGFFLIKEVFDRFMSISSEAKMMAAGDYHRDLEEINRDDEVGDLSNALNRLTQRIRSNMAEIKEYSQKTAEINLGIQKRVLLLSNLLYISSLISEGANLDEIIKAVTEKARLLASSDVAYLFSRDENQETFHMRWADGAYPNNFLDVKIEPTDEIFYTFSKTNKAIILDKNNSLPEGLTAFIRQKLGLNNTILIPVYQRKRVVQILGLGNSHESFIYEKEEVELLDILVKQLAIAVENDLLIHSVQKLEIKDSLTSLYNESFIRTRLQEEIKRAIAYQRPCAFVMLDIDNFKPYVDAFGALAAEAVIKRVAVLVRDSVSEIDRVGRTSDDEFSIILPEKNKRQAQEMAENIRKRVEFSYNEEGNAAKRLTISAGVSENPLDGISSEELISKAKELLQLAKRQGRNRVVIF
ncbi:MAG: diguanylate cyclase [Candidatus Omnitrophica bacterium]|nr:diguanylate cyclase [Candidatus Omnitrophota bacterium]